MDDALSYEDPLSLAPTYCPISFNGNDNIYSQPFVEFFFKQTKQDFLSGSQIASGDSLIRHRYDIESSAAKCEVCVPLINGGYFLKKIRFNTFFIKINF